MDEQLINVVVCYIFFFQNSQLNLSISHDRYATSRTLNQLHYLMKNQTLPWTKEKRDSLEKGRSHSLLGIGYSDFALQFNLLDARWPPFFLAFWQKLIFILLHGKF